MPTDSLFPLDRRDFLRAAGAVSVGLAGLGLESAAGFAANDTLTVACVARSAHEAEDLAAGAERWLASGDWTLVRCDRLLISPGDEE